MLFLMQAQEGEILFALLRKLEEGGLMLKDLRSFLKLLEDKGDLVHITDPVSPCYEVAAGIRKTSDIQGPALWFDNVIGHSMPVVGGLYAARRRAIWGFEANEAEVFKKFTKGLKQPIPPRIVSDGPCKEVILTDQDADFSRLSICTPIVEMLAPSSR